MACNKNIFYCFSYNWFLGCKCKALKQARHITQQPGISAQTGKAQIKVALERKSNALKVYVCGLVYPLQYDWYICYSHSMTAEGLMVLKKCNCLRNASNLTSATSNQILYMHTQTKATFWFENSYLCRKSFCSLLCTCRHMRRHTRRHTHTHVYINI